MHACRMSCLTAQGKSLPIISLTFMIGGLGRAWVLNKETHLLRGNRKGDQVRKHCI